VKGYLKTRVAGVQRSPRIQVAGRNVIEHDNVCGDFLMTERRFDCDGSLDQPCACLDALDQGYNVQHDGTKAVVPIVGSAETLPRSAWCSPGPCFKVSAATCALSLGPVQIRVGPILYGVWYDGSARANIFAVYF
jgi:hypothetical protein